MTLENELNSAKEDYSRYKKLRNNFYITTGTIGITLTGAPYLYQILNHNYGSETSSEIFILSSLLVGEISFLFNQLYKSYREKTKIAGKKVAELQK